MSSNIYEETNWKVHVKYSEGAREDRGQREDRLVDIYDSSDNFTHSHVVYTQDGGAHTQKHLPAVQRKPFRAAALMLALLCLLLLVGVTVLSTLYLSVILKSNQPDNKMQKATNGDVRDYCLQEEDNQTQGNQTRWVRFRCSCYYLSTEMKIWEESRKDCQSRGADLVIINTKEEQEHVRSLNSGDSWIGLHSVKTKAWNQQWEWVDRTQPIYLAWRVNVSLTAVHGALVYIDQQGNWNHINNGSKHWICEKQMN